MGPFVTSMMTSIPIRSDGVLLARQYASEQFPFQKKFESQTPEYSLRYRGAEPRDIEH